MPTCRASMLRSRGATDRVPCSPFRHTCSAPAIVPSSRRPGISSDLTYGHQTSASTKNASRSADSCHVRDFCALLSSCGAAKKDIGLAKESVDQFHSQLDSDQYSAIYGARNDGFRSAMSEADFTKLLQAIHHKLGNVQDAKLGNVQDANLNRENIAWDAGQGTTVRLVYATNFASGSGTEEFVWRIDGTLPSTGITSILTI